MLQSRSFLISLVFMVSCSGMTLQNINSLPYEKLANYDDQHTESVINKSEIDENPFAPHHRHIRSLNRFIWECSPAIIPWLISAYPSLNIIAHIDKNMPKKSDAAPLCCVLQILVTGPSANDRICIEAKPGEKLIELKDPFILANDETNDSFVILGFSDGTVYYHLSKAYTNVLGNLGENNYKILETLYNNHQKGNLLPNLPDEINQNPFLGSNSGGLALNYLANQHQENPNLLANNTRETEPASLITIVVNAFLACLKKISHQSSSTHPEIELAHNNIFINNIEVLPALMPFHCIEKIRALQKEMLERKNKLTQEDIQARDRIIVAARYSARNDCVSIAHTPFLIETIVGLSDDEPLQKDSFILTLETDGFFAGISSSLFKLLPKLKSRQFDLIRDLFYFCGNPKTPVKLSKGGYNVLKSLPSSIQENLRKNYRIE